MYRPGVRRSLAKDEGAPAWYRPDGGGRWRFLAALGVLTGLALLVRLPMLDFQSGDYGSFLSPWYDYIRERGFTGALGDRFSDYTPPYLYMLALSTHFPFAKIVDIKVLTLPFDLLLALGTMLLVREYQPSRLVLTAVYAGVLFAPTVVWNGAMWGQCDAIYASFSVLAVWFLVRGQPWLAVLLLGTGFAFKGQAVFIAPAFVVLTLKGVVPVRSWILFPLPYLAGITPAWLLGRSFWELVMNYREQSRLYGALVLGAPNMYQWLPNVQFLQDNGFKIAAIVIGAAMILLLHPRLEVSARSIIALTMFFALLSPFVLPRMHDRYFFLADVLSIAYACYFPRRWYLPILVVGASTFAYWPYLYGYDRQTIPLEALSALVLAALAVTARDLYALARANESEPGVAGRGWGDVSRRLLAQVRL